MKRWFLLFTFLTAACGDDTRLGNPPKGPGGPPDEEGSKVTITTSGNPPMFMAYRDDGGDWADVVEVDVGVYEIAVEGQYEVVTVCGSGSRPRTTLARFTLEEGSEQRVSCILYTDDPLYNVTGQMLQPGSVFMGSLASSTTASWTFDLDVTAGAHDLVAYDGQKILFQRDLDIQADTATDPVDLAAGAAFVSKAFTFEGTRSDDTVALETDLVTANEVVYLPGSATTAKVVPDELLADNDIQMVLATASNGTARRTIEVSAAGAVPSTLTFAPRLAGVTLEPRGAKWASMPTGGVGYSQYTPAEAAGGERRLSLVVSKGWRDANLASLVVTGELEIDLAIPGYDDAWKIDDTNHYATLSVVDAVDGVTYTSAVNKRVGGARAPGRSREEDRERLVRP
jgi:hypothetical protein